jgi:L-ascorbate metabolism protein UlaG (beta-lactamase superfamily)
MLPIFPPIKLSHLKTCICKLIGYRYSVDRHILMKSLLPLCLCFLLSACQSTGYHGPPSDHFDGTLFFFPEEAPKRQSAAYNAFIVKKTLSQFPWPPLSPNLRFPHSPPPPKMRVINHATVLMEGTSITIVTDPVFSYRVSPFPVIGPARRKPAALAIASLPAIDVVLISHNHYDHLDIPSLQRLEYRFHPLFIVPLGNKALLKRHKIQRVIELDWWQQISLKGSTITMLPAKHSSQRWIGDSNRSLCAGYGIHMDKKKIYFAGDTAYDHHFHSIRQRWGQPDIAFIPIGAYAPRALLKSEHIDPAEAVRVHLDLRAKRSIGIHWQTFQLSDVKPDAVLTALEDARQAHHVPATVFASSVLGKPIVP